MGAAMLLAFAAALEGGAILDAVEVAMGFRGC